MVLFLEAVLILRARDKECLSATYLKKNPFNLDQYDTTIFLY
jgi:hypothetical protein